MNNFHVVFLSHAASRSGAPIVLLNFLKWLKENKSFAFSIVLKNGGELNSEFEFLAPTYIWNPPIQQDKSFIDKVSSKINRILYLNKLSNNKKLIISNLKRKKPALIYANTIDTIELAEILKSNFDCPVICHVHELQAAIDILVGKARFIEAAKNINYFVAASEAVKNNLIKNIQIDTARIDVVFEFIDISEKVENINIQKNILSEFGIPEGSFIVGGSGTIEWRKGVDLFLQIALFLRDLYDIPAYFIWIGGNKNSQAFYELNYDIIKLGLEENIVFTGMKSNPLDFAAILDVFVMTSREDPYPLVCLEAAMLKKPIICFEDSGGMPEFVSNDCGFVVPYLRADLIANKLSFLSNNRLLSKELGEAGRKKVLSYHGVDYASQQILKVINSVLQDKYV